MALPKIKEVRELDNQALELAIVETKRKLFNLRFQKATRQLQTGFHQFKHERHRLAQLMTVLQERQLLSASQLQIEAEPPQAVTTDATEEK